VSTAAGDAASRSWFGIDPSHLPTAGDPANGTSDLAAVGGDLLGFRIIEELGRGAFGRVYLARQGDLADRPVVLKIAPRRDDEPSLLAQLQHTNIVPIYSIHRLGRFQVVCMPYFGATTLKEIYQNLSSKPDLPESGLELVSNLYEQKIGNERRRGPRSGSSSVERPSAEVESAGGDEALRPQSGAAAETLRYLERLTYVGAVLWVISRLASGLSHAHARGILHLDLKPGNILITDEGQPMLLDFNLSMDLKARSGRSAAVGGTVLYMSPEQLDAFRGQDRRLDGRSDVYSLGIILFELLTGRRPFPIADRRDGDLIGGLAEDRTGPPPPVRRWNPGVSPAIESIVRHCLEPDPARRYRSAQELQEDLERHLSHCALKYAPEVSLRERVAKWMRRHPTVSSTTSIAMLAITSLALLGSASWLAVRDARIAKARLHYLEFHRVFERCQVLLNTTRDGPRDSLRHGIRVAHRALEPYLTGEPGGDWMRTSMVRDLPEDERKALCLELTELIILEVRACVTLADRNGSEADYRAACRWGIDRLDLVRQMEPVPLAAYHQDRARLLAVLGQQQAAARESELAAANPLRSAQDEYLLGTSLLAQGRPDRAELFLSRATVRAPRRLWSWFALGICHSDQGRHANAAFDFAACTILAPRMAWPHLNRGLALARCGRLPEALASYNRALELDPRFVEALADRGLTHLELGNFEQARRDLAGALDLGKRTPSLVAAHAEALARLGRHDEAERGLAGEIRDHPNEPFLLVARGFARLDRDRGGAAADFQRALELDSRNPRAHLGRAHLVRRQDPRAALDAVEKTLAVEPDLGDALQLRALIRARLNDTGAEADVDRFLQVTTPQRLYNAACTLSLLSAARRDDRLAARALDYLQRALESGLPPDYPAGDPDLEGLRNNPRFATLITAARKVNHERAIAPVHTRPPS
jgi:serine/threonine protein kinase/tetratricopeptide (TPR) repeat protein